MVQSTSNCCTNENLCHAVKGTGYFFGASGASLAILVVAGIVTAIALGLLAWDGLFVYSVGMHAPVKLLWAIPVTLIFMAIDLLIIAHIAKIGAAMSFAIGKGVKHCGDQMLEHYRAIELCPTTPEN